MTNGRVLVCVASRSRSIALGRMIDSVLKTSTHADVAVYIDEDQRADYADIERRSEVHFLVGDRIGPAGSLNRIAAQLPGYSAYAAATDDCEFVTPYWDHWVLGAAERFDSGVGVISPHSSGRMDFPCVTAAWLELMGCFTPCEVYHCYWDVALEILGEQVYAIRRAKPQEFTIVHDSTPLEVESVDEIKEDAKRVVVWLAFERPKLVRKLRSAISETVEVVWP